MNPRPCGGLSPRVRGNLGIIREISDNSRSIPARAGEPFGVCGPGSHRRVYPRACGGTENLDNPKMRRHGLSPRVRGNPLMLFNVRFVKCRVF